MSTSFNQCVFAGNVTRDPEVRYLDGGSKSVAKCAIAINRKVKGNDEVMFLDVVAWDRTAEVFMKYVHKGDPILVSGRLDIRQYVNKDGENRRAVELVVSSMQMLGTKKDAGEGSNQSRDGGSSQQPHVGGSSTQGDDVWDEQIPFAHRDPEFSGW